MTNFNSINTSTSSAEGAVSEYVYPDGSTYKGQWVNAKRQGQGTLTTAIRFVECSGEVSGKMVDFTALCYKTYVGQWQDNYLINGWSFRNFYHDHKFVKFDPITETGYATKIDYDQSIQGEWENGKCVVEWI